jgi:hypothetical protein
LIVHAAAAYVKMLENLEGEQIEAESSNDSCLLVTGMDAHDNMGLLLIW